jgi:hypothetical protein
LTIDILKVSGVEIDSIQVKKEDIKLSAEV